MLQRSADCHPRRYLILRRFRRRLEQPQPLHGHDGVQGARVQADFTTKHYRWHTEQPIFRRSTKLDYTPTTNPIGFSAALVVGGIFSRY